MSAENFAELAVESRQNVLTSKLGVCADDRYASIGAIHAGLDTLRINHPYQPRSRIQPIADLRQELAGPVIIGRSPETGKTTSRRANQ